MMCVFYKKEKDQMHFARLLFNFMYKFHFHCAHFILIFEVSPVNCAEYLVYCLFEKCCK